MTKQYEFIEYEKLSDAVIDDEIGKNIYYYDKDCDVWCLREKEYPFWDIENRYAKRVEIKEKTVKAWAIIDNSEIFQVITEPDDHRLQIAVANNLQVVKLTGTIED